MICSFETMVQVVPAVVSVINTELCGLRLPAGSCPPHAACLCTEQVSALCPAAGAGGTGLAVVELWSSRLLFCSGLPVIPIVSGWSCWAELPVSSCDAGSRSQLRAQSAILQGSLQSGMRGSGSSGCKEANCQVLPQALHGATLPGDTVAL